jgi:hypothetical protein
MAIPIKIGNYRLGRTLGSGSFGKVKCKIFVKKALIQHI